MSTKVPTPGEWYDDPKHGRILIVEVHEDSIVSAIPEASYKAGRFVASLNPDERSPTDMQ